ncbi:MAG: 5'-nucleotidase C-terminal domain-containing protein [Thermoguttaceae bacterium]|nr:5'-nucleotidase C-terminal domain-containing protein [Thermoguttaceae bacterium]
MELFSRCFNRRVLCSSLVFLLVLSLFSGLTLLAEETQIAILHSNDRHGQLTPAASGFGGLAQFASLVKERRAALQEEGMSVLLLDAGDLNHGTPESDFFEAKPDILAYDLLGFDYVTFGNHEFPPQFETLERQLKLAEFPWGAANVFRADGTPLGIPYRVIELPDCSPRSTCRVGIFGLALSNLDLLPRSFGKYTIADEVETARKMVSFLREEKGAALIIAVTHLGTDPNSGTKITSLELARQVHGIDLIVDGHSHTVMEEPLFSNGTPIVSAGEKGKFLGEALLTFSDGKVTEFRWRCLRVTDELPEDPEIAALLAPFFQETAQLLDRPAAEFAQKLNGENFVCRTQPMPLGRFAADAMVWQARKDGVSCDFALLNGGNLRAGFPAGTATYRDFLAVLPFTNEVCVLEMDGKTLTRFFEFLSEIPIGMAGFAQFSSDVSTEFHREKNADGFWVYRFEAIRIRGEKIDPEKTYTLAVTDFLANGGDGYAILKECRLVQTPSWYLRDTLIGYARSLQQPISVK